MPRNDIAAIIGLIVVLWYAFLGPGRGRPLRESRTLTTLLVIFIAAFAIVWIVLRLLNY